jgi:hypothetical protein
MQVFRSGKDSNYESGYRVVVAGEVPLFRDNGTPLLRYGKQVVQRTFKWQKEGADGFHDVVVWDHMVHTACAARLGFALNQREGIARKGSRTEGRHNVTAPVAESPLEALSRALDGPAAEYGVVGDDTLPASGDAASGTPAP